MTMIERVARAIQDKIPGWLAEDGTVDDSDLARAAIKAMREPTDNMLYSGDVEYDLCSDTIDIYHAMIDEALKE